jgi:RNA recognition motif-containing protein
MEVGANRTSSSMASRSCVGRCVEEFKLANKLYVGNLPFSTTEGELEETFGKHGSLKSVKVITDRETGRSRGFAFVEFEEASSAESAQNALNGQQLGGRDLRVNEAHDKRGPG